VVVGVRAAARPKDLESDMSVKSVISVGTLASFGSRIASVMPRLLIACMVMTCALLPTQTAMAQSTTPFTYQGKLMSGGVPANGFYDIVLTPYAATTGSQTLGPQFCADNVQVVNGLFAVQVPLRMPPGGQLFLGIEVREDEGTDCASSAGLVELSPRQEVTPAPHAVYATAIREDPARVRGALRLTAGGALDIFDGSRWRRIESLSNLPTVVSGSEFFDTSGLFTFVVPQGVTEIYVAAWGGSGGGGALGPGSINIGTSCSSGTNFACAGGGGARGASIGARITVTPGETLNIAVGGGGATRANQAGGNGGTSAIRRGGVDVLVAPGGGGGGRASAGVTMPSASQTTSCFASPGILAASAGAAPAAPQLLGAGTIISTSNTSDANGGRGPSCWTNTIFNTPSQPVTTEGTCPAEPGGGGHPLNISLDAAIPTVASPANGGNGASPSTPATSGGSGRVRIYWF
jgi:hypothetical protein